LARGGPEKGHFVLVNGKAEGQKHREANIRPLPLQSRLPCLLLAIRLSSPASGAAGCTQHDSGVKPFESNPPYLWQGLPMTTDHTFLQTQLVVHDHVFLSRAH
jgi:hypothetical protein